MTIDRPLNGQDAARDAGWTRSYDPFLLERVRQFYADFAAALDEQRYRDWLTLFAEDGEYSVTDRENLATGLRMIKDVGRGPLEVRAAYLAGFWRVERHPTAHLISNVRVHSREEDDHLLTRATFLLVRTGIDGHSQVHAAGTYDDELASRGDGFVFCRHFAVVDAETQPYDFTDVL